jgi:hypothetical protein
MTQGKADNLEQFAKRIETRIQQGMAGSDSMERLICRLLTSKDRKVSALLAAKWTEWRFGKAKETIKHEGTVTHEHFDASKLSDEQIAEAERLVESAHSGSDPG